MFALLVDSIKTAVSESRLSSLKFSEVFTEVEWCMPALPLVFILPPALAHSMCEKGTAQYWEENRKHFSE